MTNSEMAKLAGGAAASITAAGASWADIMEQYLRMGASAIAIVSGIVVIVIGIASYRKNKKGENYENH